MAAGFFVWHYPAWRADALGERVAAVEDRIASSPRSVAYLDGRSVAGETPSVLPSREEVWRLEAAMTDEMRLSFGVARGLRDPFSGALPAPGDVDIPRLCGVASTGWPLEPGQAVHRWPEPVREGVRRVLDDARDRHSIGFDWGLGDYLGPAILCFSRAHPSRWREALRLVEAARLTGRTGLSLALLALERPFRESLEAMEPAGRAATAEHLRAWLERREPARAELLGWTHAIASHLDRADTLPLRMQWDSDYWRWLDRTASDLDEVRSLTTATVEAPAYLALLDTRADPEEWCQLELRLWVAVARSAAGEPDPVAALEHPARDETMRVHEDDRWVEWPAGHPYHETAAPLLEPSPRDYRGPSDRWPPALLPDDLGPEGHLVLGAFGDDGGALADVLAGGAVTEDAERVLREAFDAAE